MQLPDEDSLEPVNVIRHLVRRHSGGSRRTAWWRGDGGDPLRRDPERVRRDVTRAMSVSVRQGSDTRRRADPRTFEVDGRSNLKTAGSMSSLLKRWTPLCRALLNYRKLKYAILFAPPSAIHNRSSNAWEGSGRFRRSILWRPRWARACRIR